MIASMWKSVARWTAGLLALFFIGPLASVLTGLLRGPTGGHDASLLLSSSPISGVMVGLAVMALATIGGILAGRLVGLKSGMLVAGFVAAWGAWRLGTIESILRVAVNESSRAAGGGPPTGGSAALVTLAIEGFIVALASLVVAAIVESAARRGEREDVAPGATRKTGHPLVRLVHETFYGKPALVGLGAGAVAGAAAIWLVAFEPLKGQAVMAAVLGTIAAGAASQLAAQSMGGKATLLTPVAAMSVLALLGPLAALVFQSKHLVDALYSRELLAFAVPVSLDWAAGTLLGAPIGLSWAGVMLERHEVKAA